MDYKEKYKNAIEAVKKLQENNPSDEGIKNWVNDNFPELQESDGEIIRKKLIKIFTFLYESNIYINNTTWEGIEISKIISWLEKQGENESSHDVDCSDDCHKQYLKWGEEDERMLQSALHYVHHYQVTVACTKESTACYKWLRDLQPKKHLDENTQQWIDAIIKDYEDALLTDKNHVETIQAKINTLKSITQPVGWKPSDEQMKALNIEIDDIDDIDMRSTLRSLYNDLRKLKHE